MKTRMFFKMLTLLAASALLALSMTGCSKTVDTSTLSPGAYLNKTSDDTAQLIVVSTDLKRTTVDGTYTVTSLTSPTAGSFVPSSLNATYQVATQDCGMLKFLDTKGGVICESCLRLQLNPASYPNCPLAKFGMQERWVPLNL